MPKRQTSAVRNNFTFDDKTNTSLCLLCDKTVTGNHAGNLKKHIEKYHELEFKKQKLDAEVKLKLKNPSVQKYYKVDDGKEKTVKVLFSMKTFKEGMVEFVTKNGRPFKALEDSGFKKMLGPLLDAVNDQVGHLSINRQYGLKIVKEKAADIRKQILENTKNKILSLKFDIATRLSRGILGKLYKTIRVFLMYILIIHKFCTLQASMYNISQTVEL